MPFNPPDVQTLQRLRPLSRFSNEQLQSLCNQLRIQQAQNGERLIDIGNTGQFSLYVLQGKINMIARDGKVKKLSFSGNDALNPIAQLRPSLYDIQANGQVSYLKIDEHLLTEFAHLAETGAEDISVHIIDGDTQDNPLTMHLFQDLMADNVQLPSLPEVAQRIQLAYRDEDIDADHVANILMTDPAISAKLIRVANSPVYAGLAATETLQAAIVRLGMDTTYKQVMAYAVNELFRGHTGDVSERMHHLWSHSRRVAAISRVLAKSTRLVDPELAMLAGLTHDLGVIVIVEYLYVFSDSIPNHAQIESAIKTMRPQITGMLMRKWNFPEEIVHVAEECEDWFRNPKDEADLCDLVMVAQYHSLMGTDMINSIPPISTIPALAKMKMGPAESLELIKQSNREIKEIERILH